MFQFHKVQLKDTMPQAIQRGRLFQFHKVQLKASPVRVLRLPRSEFQFHKVQLKA